MEANKELTPAESQEELQALLLHNQEAMRAMMVSSMTEALSSYQGPIPHPEHFAKYEEVLPGAGDRIIKMAEREQENRLKSMDSQNTQRISGLWLGTFLITLLILAAVYAIHTGATALAGVILTPIIGLAIIYVLRERPLNP